MRTVKKLLSLLLIVCCISCLISTTSAASIQPMMDNANIASAKLSIDSRGEASCTVSVTSYNPLYNVSAVITLYRVSNGHFYYIDSWSASGIGGFTKSLTRSVTKGPDYQIKANVTIFDLSGNALESASVPSNITR